MNNLNKLDIVTASLLGSISFLLITIFLSDIQNANQNPEIYELVHHMSVDEYIKESLNMTLILISSLLISVLVFTDRKRIRIWKTTLYIYATSFISLYIYSYIAWAAAGFNH